MRWYLEVIKKYAVFSGRAERREYWFFTLFNLIFFTLLYAFDLARLGETSADYIPLSMIYALAVFLPNLAVTVRRLHDTGRSGWWTLIACVPVIGWIVLLAFLISDSQPGTNRYGPSNRDMSVQPRG